MTQISPTALEEAAKAMEPNAFETLSRGYTQRNYFENRAFLNAEKVVKRANKKATAAITAYLAQVEKEGWVMVPRDLTPDMIVQGYEHVNRDLCEGRGNALNRLWAAMLAAAQNGGDLPAPPMGK